MTDTTGHIKVAMPLNDFQRERCVKIIDQLISFPICVPFVEMVDPDRDGAPDYYQRIDEPMALQEVKRRLLGGKYDDIDGFKHDVNLIWENSVTYNGEDSIFGIMAREAQLWFRKKMDRFSDSAKEDWLRRVRKAALELVDTLNNTPAELDPSAKAAQGKEGEESA